MGYAFPRAKTSRVVRPASRSRRRCAGCRPTGSTSTSCTCRIPRRRSRRRLAALDDLVREGKIRYYGHSNFCGLADRRGGLRRAEPRRAASSRRRTTTACSRGRPSARCCRPCERFGLGFFPFFPLHNGLLTGKFTREGGPEGSRIMMQRRHVWQDAPWDALEQLPGVLRRAGHHDARGDLRLAAVAAGPLQRDRRRDQCRSGARRTRPPRGVDADRMPTSRPSTRCSRSPEDPAARV